MIVLTTLLTLLGTVEADARQPWGWAPESEHHQQSPPSYRFTSFTYPATPTLPRRRSSSTQAVKTTYAVPYASVASLFSNVSTTTWDNWTPAVSTRPVSTSAAYDNAALFALWDSAKPVNFTRGLYSTTVSPTSVPSSELRPPSPLYFRPEHAYSFPKDFIFGAAGSASQCEGAIADEGKSPSFMDMVATLFSIIGPSGGNIATGTIDPSNIAKNYVTLEHYYLYKQDITRLAAAGLKTYSFSIPWTRVLPFALPGTPVNAKAIAHYNDVIDFVLSVGMQSVVTLTHFDTPLVLYGGSDYLLQLARADANATYGVGQIDWAYDNATFVDAYVNYARIVLSHFADRVPTWITFNEPQIGTLNGIAVRNVLQAHARTYHFYKDELKGRGRMSLKMGLTPAVPLDPHNASHVAAANFFTDVYVGPFLAPLALGEDYPTSYKQSVADHVPLTAEDLAYLNSTIDFVALDLYTALVVIPSVTNLTACALDVDKATNPQHVFPFCVNVTSIDQNGCSIGYSPFGSPAQYWEPYGIRTQLNYAWNKWEKPVLVSEFGLDVPVPPGGRLQDNLFNVPQSEYLLSYLNEMLKAIWEDGVDVIGALVWNWGDDWEFSTFDDGFGLQYVNFTTQERRYRRSIFDVVDFVEGNRLQSAPPCTTRGWKS